MPRKPEEFRLRLGKDAKEDTSLQRLSGIRFFVSYVFPLLLFLSLMVFVSSQSTLASGSVGLDLSFLHTIEYFVLSTLILRLLVHYRFENGLAIAILLALFVGIMDELYQASVPARTSSIIDVLYDGAGASLILLFKRFPRLLF